MNYPLVNLRVILELLVGEFLFIHVYEKRKYFWIRFPLSVAVCTVLVCFFPTFATPVPNLFNIIRFVVFFVCTVAVYAFCFKLKIKVILALCSAGYALQHIVYQLSNLFHKLPFGSGFNTFVMSHHRIVEIVFFVVIYSAFFLIFRKRLAKCEIDKNFNNVLNLFTVIVVGVCIILSLFAGHTDIPAYASIYSIICCTLVLVLQFAVLGLTRLIRENVSIKMKIEADIARYESAKDAIDFINIKCHDLKKELSGIKSGANIEELNELKNTIEIYDSIPRTGNSIIDTVMINSTLRHSQSGVRFTFSGNGEWLNFVNPSDLKSLFINAVSNAADAATNAPADKRSVSIVLEKKGDMVMITVRNYYVGEPIGAKQLPASTKKDNPEEHGFGLKSMKLVAKKYGGELMSEGADGIFVLNIYLINK